MQNNAGGPLSLDKRKMHGGQYDVPPPPDGGTLTELHK